MHITIGKPELSCNHQFTLKETDRVIQSDGRSGSRCETWIQREIYFCTRCLKEETIKKEWCGQAHYSDRPDWTKVGSWRSETIW